MGRTDQTAHAVIDLLANLKVSTIVVARGEVDRLCDIAVVECAPWFDKVEDGALTICGVAIREEADV